jgi:hypothetical protein
LYQCIKQSIVNEIRTAKVPLHRALESNLPTGTFPPNIIPCTPYAMSKDGASIERIRWPDAVESDEGTVQDEIKTNMKPETARILPGVLALPLRLIQMPNGTKRSGIQNQIAASNTESIIWTATL